ncbi:MAG: anti-sigma factor antagonist [Oscillospiraceae bacterium]
MKLLTNCHDGRLRVNLSGELDHHSAKDAMNGISKAIDDCIPRECVLDFSGLTFMDSSGVALILRVYKRMRDCEGKMWVENLQRQPLKVIDASGIDRVVRILSTVKEGEK